MSSNGRTWDVKFSKGVGNMLRVNIPTPVSRSLIEAGFTHVTLSLTDDGILLRPYEQGESQPAPASVDLPTAWSA